MAVRHRGEVVISDGGTYMWMCTACYEGGSVHPTEADARREADEHEADPGVDDSDLIDAGLLAEEGEDDGDDWDGYGEEDW